MRGNKSTNRNQNLETNLAHENYRLSADPVDRAMQISKIIKMADEGNTDAISWVAEFRKSGTPPPLSESIFPKNNHKDTQAYELLSFKSPDPEKDFFEYNEYMDGLIAKASAGNTQALSELEPHTKFIPTQDQSFDPKIFDSYQDYNRFIIDIERNHLPLFINTDPQLDELRRENKKYYTALIQAEGKNNLNQREIKDLKRQLNDLARDKDELIKKNDELQKFLQNESDRSTTGMPHVIHTNRGYVDLGKMPPHAVELEEIVLGSALKMGRLLEEFSQPYLNLMFYKDTHQKIHRAMMDIHVGKINVSKVTEELKNTDAKITTGVRSILTTPKIKEKLRQHHALDEIGGPVYLEKLMASGIDDEKLLKEYCGIIEKKYLRREIIRVTSEIQTDAYDESKGDDSVPEWIRRQALKFLDIMPFRFKIYYDLKSLVGQTIGSFRKLMDRNGRPQISTGYEGIDRMTHGVNPGTLVFTGMRGKNGKTTLSTNIADNVAKQNRHVLIFTYESSRQELIQKLIAKRARVDLEKFVYFDDEDKLTFEERNSIYDASQDVKKLPIIMEGRPAEPEYVLRMCRFYKGMYPDLSLIIIDGLQAFANKEMPKGKNKSDYLYDLLTTFKNEIAIDLNTMVWVNGQLKGDVEERKSKRPIDARDYSDCKGIPEVADVAILGHRPGKYFDRPEFQGWLALWPTENRAGSEKGRATRLGIEEKFGNVYELPKNERKYDYAKYDALNNIKGKKSKDANSTT